MQPHRDLLIPLCAALFVAACLVHDWRRHRVVHPAYVIGGLVIIASWPLRIMIGHSEWYFPIGEQVARLAHSNLDDAKFKREAHRQRVWKRASLPAP